MEKTIRPRFKRVEFTVVRERTSCFPKESSFTSKMSSLMKPYKTNPCLGEQLAQHLRLPESDCFCPHIEAVTVIQGPALTQVTRDGTHEYRNRTGKSMSGRGSQVCLTFFTEEGMRIFVTYSFHKGEVFVKTDIEPTQELVEGGVASDDKEVLIPTELWRD